MLTVRKHFMTDKQKSIGRGKFLKICKDSMLLLVGKLTCLTILVVPLFYFFSAVSEIIKMSYESYGFFRKEFLNDKKGKLIETDELFLNIYDFWVLKHAFFMRCKCWYYPKITKLEGILRSKWERAGVKVKTLP